MSKSKGNVINPDDYIEQYGADTLRMYLMFLGPLDHGGDFTEQGIGGITRFLNRVWNVVNKHAKHLHRDTLELEYQRNLHKTIQRVTDDIKRLKYNTAIAALMEYLNLLQSRESLFEEEITTFLRLLAPFAPHISEELWQRIGGEYSVHQQSWPQANPELLIEEQVEIAVQINGKMRAIITLPVDAEQKDALAIALQTSAVQRYVGNSVIKRVIYVPNRIVNIVVE